MVFKILFVSFILAKNVILIIIIITLTFNDTKSFCEHLKTLFQN